MEQLVIPVEGMTCSGCTGSVKRAVERLPGVAGATATLAPGEVRVELSGGPTGLAEVVGAITRAGYDVPAAWRAAQGLV